MDWYLDRVVRDVRCVEQPRYVASGCNENPRAPRADPLRETHQIPRTATMHLFNVAGG
jgi:hypothetical protein